MFHWFSKLVRSGPPEPRTRLRSGAARAPEATPSAASPPAEWPVGSLVLNAYKVQGLLGEGGFGRVYLLSSVQAGGYRFAVKRAIVRGELERRQFLDELRHWVDLPEHPHLVTCRFFRSIGSEIVIFADYVEGRDLAAWMANGEPKSLETILDVAIQFAWGLHAAHEFGVVHQDVKPSNALLGRDGVVRVADFGLARARSRPRAAAASSLAPNGGPAVADATLNLTALAEHGGGLTPAYSSPEQRSGMEVSRRSDVWSWGVSVMELLAGRCGPRSDFDALTELESQAFPAPIAQVLRRSLQADPKDRWATLLQATEALAVAYQAITGKPYPRAVPAFPRCQERRVADLKQTLGEASWDDPLKWLPKALSAAGRDPSEAADLIHRSDGSHSRTAQAVADLGTYQAAERLFEDAIRNGRKNLRDKLAWICCESAVVHRSVGDLSGAMRCADRSIEIYEQLLRERDDHDIAWWTAHIYAEKAELLALTDHAMEAQRFIERSIAIYTRLGDEAKVATGWFVMATILLDSGQLDQALTFYQKSQETFERVIDGHGEVDYRDVLGQVYSNEADTLEALGDLQRAMDFSERAITLYEQLAIRERRRDCTAHLANSYGQKAALASDLRDYPTALSLVDQGIGILDRLINQDGRDELSEDLASLYTKKGAALAMMGDKRAAASLCDRAISIRERLVHQEGQYQLAPSLADAYMNRGIVSDFLQEFAEAVARFEQSITLYERLVYQEKHLEWEGDLAKVNLHLAGSLRALGDRRRATPMARAALTTVREVIRRTGRDDMKFMIHWAESRFPDLLG